MKNTAKDGLHVNDYIKETLENNNNIVDQNKKNNNDDLLNLGGQYNENEDESNVPFISIYQVDNILSKKSFDKTINAYKSKAKI